MFCSLQGWEWSVVVLGSAEKQCPLKPAVGVFLLQYARERVEYTVKLGAIQGKPQGACVYEQGRVSVTGGVGEKPKKRENEQTECREHIMLVWGSPFI